MLINKAPASLGRRFISFVLYGGLNTLVTYLLYLLLATSVHYQVAYLIAYTSGIALAYILNLRLVFNAQSSLGKIARYPLIYAAQYLLGAGLLHLFVSLFGLSNALAPLLVIAMLLPVSYSMNKIILARDFTRAG